MVTRAPIIPGPNDKWTTRIHPGGGYGKSAIWKWSVIDVKTHKELRSGTVKGARAKAEAAIDRALHELGPEELYESEE